MFILWKIIFRSRNFEEAHQHCSWWPQRSQMWILWEIFFYYRKFKDTHAYNSWRPKRLQMWFLWKIIQPLHLFGKSHQKDSQWSKEPHVQHLQQIIYYNSWCEQPHHEKTWKKINLTAIFCKKICLLFEQNPKIEIDYKSISANSHKLYQRNESTRLLTTFQRPRKAPEGQRRKV